MIKVLHVVNGTAAGGISMVVLNCFHALDSKQFHFDLATASEEKGSLYDTFIEQGFEVDYIGNKHGKNLFKHCSELRQLIKSRQYDVIHVHQAESSWVELLVAKQCGVRIRVAHAHNAIREKGKMYSRLRRATGKVLIKLFSTNRIGCGRDAAICTFGKKALIEKDFVMLPNAVDLQTYLFSEYGRCEIRREFNIPSDAYVIGEVGRLDTEKNQIYLIKLMPDILRKKPNTYLLLTGDGGKKDSWLKCAHELGVSDHIVFTGARKDICKILSAMDVFVLPSIYEGFPVSIIEATANGLNCVLSDTITDELKFLNTVQYVSLENQNAWINRMLESYRIDGDDQVALLKERGFDSSSTGKILENIYRGEIR